MSRQEKNEALILKGKSNSQAEIPLQINLDYKYYHDDICLIWEAQENLIQDCLRKQNVPEENIEPIARLSVCDISVEPAEGEMGNLSTYLKDKRNEASKETKKRRFIFIPFNTGDHWVAILLHIQEDNTLDFAAYINSSHE